MCPLDSESLMSCSSEEVQAPDLSAVSQQSEVSFKVNVGLFDNIKVKFRMLRRLVKPPSLSADLTRNLCGLPDNKLGTVFQEVNLKFYRLCHI